MNIFNKWDIGDTVYIKTDIDQIGYMITNFLISSTGVEYGVRYDDRVVYFYDFELSSERDVLKVTTN